MTQLKPDKAIGYLHEVQEPVVVIRCERMPIFDTGAPLHVPVGPDIVGRVVNVSAKVMNCGTNCAKPG